jgi:D-alanyl-lipoteichoic acid acyltransferase DltB (MBOAT superfamily)
VSLVEPSYLLFLVVAAVLYRAASGTPRLAAFVLVGASLLFYATWNPLCCVALAVTAAVDFAVGRALGREERPAVRRALVSTSLAVDLGLLVGFKYWGLFARGLPYRIVFAAGISFYTFQSLSYVLDVYRRDREPVESFPSYLAFVSFFPTLLAGPITRADTFFPQLERPRPFDDLEGGAALLLIAIGFIKKCLIADTLAVNLTSRVFDVPGLYSSVEVLAGIYGYAVQIWGDFSGYSDIAIGSALLLGIRLKENFNRPYRSADLTEFWRRWHISLSTWLRDYLFFSLPGKRPGTPWPYLNLVVTFGLGGLWHGASWTFAIWGLMHGVGLAAHRFVQSFRRSRRPAGKRPLWREAAGVFVTFHFVCATWVFFRCATLGQAVSVFRVLLDGTGGAGNVTAAIAAAIAAGLVAQFLPEAWLSRLQARFVLLPSFAQATVLLLAAATIRHVSGSAVAPFIYFAF